MHQLFLVFILFASSVVYATETLIFGTTAQPPFSQKNQKGFIDLIVAEALARTGNELLVSYLPAERALTNANNGVDDGDLLRIGGLGKFYPNLIQASEKTFSMEFIALSRKAKIKTSDWNSLKPYSVAYITGWKIFDHNLPPGLEVIKVKNAQQLFYLLLNDRVDIILFEKWFGLHYIKVNKIKDINILQPPLASRDMFVYFNKKHKKLVPRFSSALRDMKKDGTYQAIFQNILLPLIK